MIEQNTRMKKGFTFVALTLGLAFVLIQTRCGVVPTSNPAAGTFTNVYSIFKSHNCVQCHAPNGSATVNNNTTLDFTSKTTAYSTLTGGSGTTGTVAGTTSIGTCSGVKLITASDASKSYLAAVLFSSYNKNNFAGKTNCQPYTGDTLITNLSTDEQTTVINWIQGGALNN